MASTSPPRGTKRARTSEDKENAPYRPVHLFKAVGYRGRGETELSLPLQAAFDFVQVRAGCLQFPQRDTPSTPRAP